MVPWYRGWKIVREDRGDLWSCFAGNVRVDSRRTPVGTPVLYGIDRETKQPVNSGALAVFKTEGQVKDFINMNRDVEVSKTWKVFKCLYKPSATHVLYGNGYTLKDIPAGTAFACSVILLEEEEKK